LLYSTIMNWADYIYWGPHFIEGSFRGASNNVLLGTKDSAVVLEFNKDCVQEIKPEKKLLGCDLVGVTNHFRSADLVQYQEMGHPPFEVEVGADHLTKAFSEQRLVTAEGLTASDLKTALTGRYPVFNEGTIFTTLVDFAKNELTVVISHRAEELVVPLTW